MNDKTTKAFFDAIGKMPFKMPVDYLKAIDDALELKDKELVKHDHHDTRKGFLLAQDIVKEIIKSVKTLTPAPQHTEVDKVAVAISEMVVPKLTAHEQSFFIAGFQECIKWLSQSPQHTGGYSLQQAAEKIERMKDNSGREGCTYGDTDYDSLSAVYGYNLAIDNIVSYLSSLHLSPTAPSDAIEFAEWMGCNGYTKHQVNPMWYDDDIYIGSTSELYEIFKQRP